MSSRPVRRKMRANRLDERYAIAIGLVSGAVAAFAGAAPTGSLWIDRCLVGIAVGVVTWASASAAWWALSMAAGVATVVAIDPALTAIGAVAFAGGLRIGVRRRDMGTERCLVGALSLNVLVRAELDRFFGASALVGISVAVLLFVVGIRRRPRAIRRVAWTSVGGLTILTVLAVTAFGVSGASARTELSRGQQLATDGIAELGRGNFSEAAAKFTEASGTFSSASRQLDRPWALPAQVVPVVAQNADAVTDLAAAAADSTAQLGTSLAQIDPDTLRIVGGRVDLAAIEAVAGPLQDVQASLDDLDATVAATDSPWLLTPVRTRVDRLADDIDHNEQRLDNAVTAAQLAPRMLGGDQPRRYLFIFTTPAEARGEGGFMGNFAEVEAVDGQLSVTRFGRTDELNAGGPDPTARVVTGPQDWLDQWGRFGFRIGAAGTTAAEAWSNITMSPNFPSTAQVIAELYPQSGGQPLDGVFAIDPYAIASLLELTGPIQIPGTQQALDSSNVVDFLLRDQYAITDDPQRIDLLAEVAEATISRILDGALPDPATLADGLAPVVSAGRLLGWSADPDEEALLDAVRMSGALPELGGRDGVAVVINNAAANKIDVYLDRSTVYRASIDPATGQVVATLEVTLTNQAPASGLPDVVIGNLVGQPPGTNQALVSFYTALNPVSVERDGQPISVETGREGSWNTARTSVDLPAGASTTFVIKLVGTLDVAAGYSLFTRPEPLVLPEQLDVSVSSTTGDQVLTIQGPQTEPQWHAGTAIE